MTKNGTVETEGANIVYDYEGSGPVLLTIAGAGGDARGYAPLASLLADEYTVLRYDRRCKARSTGDASITMDMAQSARDAAAVIRAMGIEKGYVFGNSGGANIALKLAEDLPEVITGLVIHEPPIIPILPDTEKWQNFVQEVHQTYLTKGVGPAMQLFASAAVNVDLPAQGQGIDMDFVRSMDFFMAKEYVPLGTFMPDLDTISRNGVQIVAAAGRRSEDAYYARSARILAERLNCPYVEFPGNHFGFAMEAQAFATVLREVLHNFKD